MALPRRLFEGTITLFLMWLLVLMVCLLSLVHGTPLYASGTFKREITYKDVAINMVLSIFNIYTLVIMKYSVNNTVIATSGNISKVQSVCERSVVICAHHQQRSHD